MIDKTHIIHTKSRVVAHKKFIVCAGQGKKSKIDVDLNMLHTIGYWGEEEDNNVSMEEVWIPFSEVSFVSSLVYRPR